MDELYEGFRLDDEEEELENNPTGEDEEGNDLDESEDKDLEGFGDEENL